MNSKLPFLVGMLGICVRCRMSCLILPGRVVSLFAISPMVVFLGVVVLTQQQHQDFCCSQYAVCKMMVD